MKKIVDNLSGVKQFVENARSKCKKCKTFSDAKPFSGKAISPWELAIGGLSADVSVSCMKGCFSYSYTINDYYDFDWHGNWLCLGSDRGGFSTNWGFEVLAYWNLYVAGRSFIIRVFIRRHVNNDY